MSSYPPGLGVGDKSVLIEALKDDESFVISNSNLPSKKGVIGYYNIRRLASDMIAFARDPALKNKSLDKMRPEMPKTDGLSPEEVVFVEREYRETLSEYETAKLAISRQVHREDWDAITFYIEPFLDAIRITPAIKAHRFRALTRDPQEEKGGFLGLGGPKQQR